MDIRTFEDMLNVPNIKRALAEAIPVTGIQFDSDIIGATKGQADLLLAGIPDLKTETVDGVTKIVSGVGVKLSALRYHAKRFEELQVQRKEEIEDDERMQGIVKSGLLVAEKEMIFEFEAFMFQVKSTLDMLVKLFVPVFGGKQADISTYGKAGEKVITYLQQLKRNKKKRLAHARVDLLIDLVREAKDPWLKPLIAIRDTVSHYSSQIGIGFTWDKATKQVRIPMANVGRNEFPVVEVMKLEVERLVDYSTQFIAGTILSAIPVERHYQPLTEMEKKYVSALWGMDMSKAVLKLSSNVIYEYTDADIERARKTHLEKRTKLVEAN